MTTYPTPLVWFGTWESPEGLFLQGYHVWDRMGKWIGVYQSICRAVAESAGL
jgi:hypothetical protein